MREIKFRAKTIKKKRWVYGDLIHQDNIIKIEDEIGDRYCVEPDTVGQHTGLKDKNGVEIYEGDILSNRERSELYNFPFGYGVVKFGAFELTDSNDIAYGFYRELFDDVYKTQLEDCKHAGFDCNFDGFEECIVVGNIYDNPDFGGKWLDAVRKFEEVNK